MKYTQILMNQGLKDLNPILAGIAYEVPLKGPSYQRLSHTLLHYVFKGKGYLHLNGSTYHIKTGQAFILPTGSQASYAPDPEDPWSYRWIGFTGTYSHAFEHFPPVVDLPDNCLSVLDLLATPGFELKKIAHQLTSELFTLYHQFLSQYGAALQYASAADIHAVVDYIQNNHTNKISVEAIANMMHVDRTYLCKRFKKKIGCSMQQYILDMRVMTAMRLIENGLSFKETAYQSGFNDPSNFTKVFTREVGKTPSEWKQFLLDNFEAFQNYKNANP